jgi:hypothetical protein
MFSRSAARRLRQTQQHEWTVDCCCKQAIMALQACCIANANSRFKDHVVGPRPVLDHAAKHGPAWCGSSSRRLLISLALCASSAIFRTRCCRRTQIAKLSAERNACCHRNVAIFTTVIYRVRKIEVRRCRCRCRCRSQRFVFEIRLQSRTARIQRI